MHLTNYSINKASPDYVWEPEDILSPNDGSKRTLTALFRQFEAEGIDVDKIKESIKYSCQGVMQMFGSLIQH
jgi:predicted chitinase